MSQEQEGAAPAAPAVPTDLYGEMVYALISALAWFEVYATHGPDVSSPDGQLKRLKAIVEKCGADSRARMELAAPALQVIDAPSVEPVGYARESELAKLADKRIAGVGMMISKDASEGTVALYLAPIARQAQPTDRDAAPQEIEVSVDYPNCRHVAPIKAVFRSGDRLAVLVEGMASEVAMDVALEKAALAAEQTSVATCVWASERGDDGSKTRADIATAIRAMKSGSTTEGAAS